MVCPPFFRAEVSCREQLRTNPMPAACGERGQDRQGPRSSDFRKSTNPQKQHPQPCAIGVSEGEKSGNGAKAILEKTMAKNFPKLSGRLILHY